MSEELKKDILSKQIDADQLDQAAGGTMTPGSIACSYTSRREDCTATVEYGSWCSSSDACLIWDCKYDGCSSEYVDSNL